MFAFIGNFEGVESYNRHIFFRKGLKEGNKRIKRKIYFRYISFRKKGSKSLCPNVATSLELGDNKKVFDFTWLKYFPGAELISSD